MALLGDLRGSHPTRSAIRTKTLCSRLIVEFIALELRRLESRLHHQLRIPLVHDRQAKMLGTHVAQDPLRQAQQFARESTENPALDLAEVCEGGSDQFRSYQLPREPGISASEGAKNICKRGRSERISSQRARKRRRTIKSSPSRLDDIIESQCPGATPRETPIIRPIAIRILRGSITRTEDKIFTRARQHRYKSRIESRGDSTILFFRSNVPSTSMLNLRSLFFIQARREATRTKPPISSREDPLNRYRDYIEPTSK